MPEQRATIQGIDWIRNLVALRGSGSGGEKNSFDGRWDKRMEDEIVMRMSEN